MDLKSILRNIGNNFKTIFEEGAPIKSWLRCCCILLIYLGEVLFHYLISYEYFMSFVERPMYQIYTVNNTNGDNHVTINKVGTTKDCGVFTESDAHRKIKFLNEFPIGMPFIVLSLYVLATIILFIFDLIYTAHSFYLQYKKDKYINDNNAKCDKTVCDKTNDNKKNKYKVKDDKEYKYSKCNKDCLTFIYKVIPVFKLICLGNMYPLTSVEYETCISTKFEFLIDITFFHSINIIGYILNTGLMSLIVYSYFRNY